LQIISGGVLTPKKHPPSYGLGLRVGYGEHTVHETKRNADALETPTLLDDEVRQPGIMTVPGHEEIL